jgi:peptidoglycan/xylan/chitin deacetylase (PgdA/CDA1 family)
MYRPAPRMRELADREPGARAAARAVDVPVLMYHSIATRAAPRFARFVVAPGEFAAQMEYLAAEGYQPVTALDLARSVAADDLPAKPVVLTFDDAYTDFESAVMPILQAHDFPATLYVPTAYVGGTASWLLDCNEDQRPILSWQAIRDIAATGIEVASHSHRHSQLDRIPLPVVNDEVRRSRQLLEDQLGATIEGFAYPFGYWNRSVRSAVAAAGYSYACAVGELVVSAADDPWTLPRVTVGAGTGTAGLAELLAGRSTRAGRWSSDLKRHAWAAMRRGIRPIGGDPQVAQRG